MGLPATRQGVKKKSNTQRPQSMFTLLRQVCNLIPVHLTAKLARECGVAPMCRTFSAWSHVVSMLYAQLTHCIGLNDVCDSLSIHGGPLSAIRGATPPARNTLSHAGRNRPAAMLGHLQTLAPEFSRGGMGRGVARRFRRTIHIAQKSFSASWPPVRSPSNPRCMDWASHRRRKAPGPPQPASALRHRGHRPPQRPEARPRGLCGDPGRGDRGVRPRLRGLRPPLRPVPARGLLGDPHQDQLPPPREVRQEAKQ